MSFLLFIKDPESHIVYPRAKYPKAVLKDLKAYLGSFCLFTKVLSLLLCCRHSLFHCDLCLWYCSAVEDPMTFIVSACRHILLIWCLNVYKHPEPPSDLFSLAASMIMVPAAAYVADPQAQEAFLICLRDDQDPILSCLIPFVWYESDPKTSNSLLSLRNVSHRNPR